MSPSSTPSSHASAPPPESTETASSGRRSGAVLVASLMLFSMFFGAGNLIFPPMLGAQAGTSTAPALLGFLSTGVLLPVLAILAIAVTGRDLQDLANRGGRIFGVVFTVLVYLSIGAFYALPRTASVSYETAIAPHLGQESLWITVAFSAVFFAVSLALAFDPSGIVDRLGRFLTPALLILLVVLITMAVLRLSTPGHGPPRTTPPPRTSRASWRATTPWTRWPVWPSGSSWWPACAPRASPTAPRSCAA